MASILTRDVFVWTIGTLCGLHKVHFDAEILLQRFLQPYDLRTLQCAAKALGIHVSVYEVDLRDIHPAVYPVFAILKPQSEQPVATEQSQSIAQSALASRFFGERADNVERISLVLRRRGSNVLLLEPGNIAPRTIPISNFNDIATRQTILFSRVKSQEQLSQML